MRWSGWRATSTASSPCSTSTVSAPSNPARPRPPTPTPPPRSSRPTTPPPARSASCAPTPTPRSPPTPATSRPRRCSPRSRPATPRSRRCSPGWPTGSRRSAPTTLAALHPAIADHVGPLRRLAVRAEHQMSESEEHLYAELATTGSSAWSRLHRDDHLAAHGRGRRSPTAPPRCRSTPCAAWPSHGDPAVRQAGVRRRARARGPPSPPVCAAAMNAIKGEANTVNRRRGWAVAARRIAVREQRVSRPTFDAMQRGDHRIAADDFRGWMRTKARLHGHDGPLPWRDLFAPLPVAPGGISWEEGLAPRARRLRRLQRPARVARRPGRRRTLDRRSTARRQGGRGVLHVVRRRPVAGAAQLERLGRLGPDHRARARPRLPQHPARRTARRCSGDSRWRWPRRRASSARPSWSRPG